MASEPVNGEGTDGAREKHRIKVYTRKGKGQRKQASFFSIEVSGATDNREKPEGKLENEKENNHVNSPETIARESVDPTVVANNSVEEVALETNSQEDVGASIPKNSTEAPSENLPGDDSDKVIDKPLVEALSQAEPQDDVSLAATDKNVIQPPTDPLGQDDVNTIIVGEKSVEVPSESHKTQDDVNTVVVDENSIKEPPKTLSHEDVTNMIVDKNSIEAPSQTLSVEDVNTVVVDKNPIEVSSEEHVHVVDTDSLIKEAHHENLVERDATDAQQPAGLSSDPTAAGSVPMEEGEDGRIRIHVPSKSKQQKEEIRKKLEDQLNLVRGLVKKIEDKEGEIGAYNDSRVLVNTGCLFQAV